ncbi:MAG: UDP-N-acetylmuramoyl-L-alanyl-D-glutamate--2,6-diaminopimelate ligase [Rhodobacteraceae bacterium]|nr:UDP-N-acetylmuramoyl-L-alanyl-D-glutamate--2,6-diaminopimelate ligase [Paracoccaceae bacterium]
MPGSGLDVTGATLAELGLHQAPDPEIRSSGICLNSGGAESGFLFAALPGSNRHGAEFAGEALDRGAVAILTDQCGAGIVANSLAGTKAQLVVVENPHAELARVAARWFAAAPATAVAVTGTNGKTSVVSMCRQIWQLLGRNAVSCGTLGIEGVYSARLQHTTPDPVTLHRHLAGMAAQGVSHVALEASSHGLAQYRLDGVALSAAAFTNLTHDHLDYHVDEKSYFNAKAGLFDRVLDPGAAAVICTGSPYGTDMAAIAAARGQRVLTIGGTGADIEMLAQRAAGTGQSVRFSWEGGQHQISLGLIGEFQAWNLLTAVGLVIAAGEDPEAVIAVLDQIRPVPGRMQLAARRENGAAVFVDYAHTPDALQASLSALRQHCLGRLVVLFGAGGDRDRKKRPAMGGVAQTEADAVIITDDNPRNEDPASIRSEILGACRDCLEVGDRAEAILRGVAMLGPGDVLLVAGKGHESGQEIAGVTHPFDDVEQASMAAHILDGQGA